MEAAAAIIGILTPAIQVTRDLYKIWKKLGSAAEDVQWLWLQAKAFRGTLEVLWKLLEEGADDPVLDALQELCCRHSIVPICLKILEDMDTVIQGIRSIDDSPILILGYTFSRRLTKRRIGWLFKQSKVGQLYTYLLTTTTMLNTSILCVTIQKLRRAPERNRDELLDMQRDIKENTTQLKFLRRKISSMQKINAQIPPSSGAVPTLAEVFARCDPTTQVLLVAQDHIPQRNRRSSHGHSPSPPPRARPNPPGPRGPQNPDTSFRQPQQPSATRTQRFPSNPYINTPPLQQNRRRSLSSSNSSASAAPVSPKTQRMPRNTSPHTSFVQQTRLSNPKKSNSTAPAAPVGSKSPTASLKAQRIPRNISPHASFVQQTRPSNPGRLSSTAPAAPVGPESPTASLISLGRRQSRPYGPQPPYPGAVATALFRTNAGF